MKLSFFKTITLAFILTGCGLSADNKEAQLIVDQFYGALKIGDAAGAASFCATDDNMTNVAWSELFTQNMNSLGNVITYEKGSGFNVSKENGVSTVSLTYKVAYQFGKSEDSLQLIDKGDGFKLFNYAPQLKEARFQEEIRNAEAIVMQYMSALQTSDYAKAISFLGYSGVEQHATKEWTDFFFMMETQAGSISNFTIDGAKSKSYLHTEHAQSGIGNIYSITVNTTRNGKIFPEQIDLFQPDFGEQLKIIAHNTNI